MEIRIESVNKDNSHSWVRTSHGLNKLVTDLIDKEYDDNEQETFTTKTEVFAFASQSKAKAKPRTPSTTCSSSRAIPILERTWIDIEPGAQFDLAQRKGLKFYQTRSSAVILYDTLPAYCISKKIVMESEEIIYQKVYVSPQPPPTISFQDNWTCDLDSDVARSNKDIQRFELKPNTQLSSTGRLVTKWSEETLERTKFDRDTLNQEKHDNVTDPTSTGRPVCGHESTERCVLTH